MTNQAEQLSRAIRLIAGDQPSKLLFENFRIVVVGLLRTQHVVDAERRKPRDLRENLSNIVQASETLLKAVHDVEIVSYLNQVGPTAFNYLHILIPGLEDIVRRAKRIDQELPNGSGRRRYTVGEFSIDAMRLCAIVVLEASKIEHDKIPGPYNEKLWEAADIIWTVSGGAEFSVQDSLERWKRPFVEMSKANITTVRHETIREILNLRPIDLTKVHTTELGTE